MSFHLIIQCLLTMLIASTPLSLKERIPQIQLGLVHTLTYSTPACGSHDDCFIEDATEPTVLSG